MNGRVGPPGRPQGAYPSSVAMGDGGEGWKRPLLAFMITVAFEPLHPVDPLNPVQKSVYSVSSVVNVSPLPRRLVFRCPKNFR
jgi:hypothetical protein